MLICKDFIKIDPFRQRDVMVSTVTQLQASLQVVHFLGLCIDTTADEHEIFKRTIEGIGATLKKYADSNPQGGLKNITQPFKEDYKEDYTVSNKLRAVLTSFETVVLEENPDYQQFVNRYLLKEDPRLLPNVISWQLLAVNISRLAVFVLGILCTPLSSPKEVLRSYKMLALYTIFSSLVYQIHRFVACSAKETILAAHGDSYKEQQKERILQNFQKNYSGFSVESQEEVGVLLKSAEKSLALSKKRSSSTLINIALGLFSYLGLLVAFPFLFSSLFRSSKLVQVYARCFFHLGLSTVFAKRGIPVPCFRDLGAQNTLQIEEESFLEKETAFLRKVHRCLIEHVS